MLGIKAVGHQKKEVLPLWLGPIWGSSLGRMFEKSREACSVRNGLGPRQPHGETAKKTGPDRTTIFTPYKDGGDL